MKLDFFNQANPVWAKGLVTEKNITLGLRGTIDVTNKDNVVINVATSGIYRIFVNGQFVGHGPARGPHDYYRVDQLEISDKVQEGVNIIAIEAACYNVNSFYLLDQPSFIQVEAIVNCQTVLATSLDELNQFNYKIIEERIQKVQRYSFQRPFIEVYSLSENYASWRNDLSVEFKEVEMTITEEKNLIERRVSYPKYNIVHPEKFISTGKSIKEIKEINNKDRALVDIGDQLKGFKEDELTEHVSDEVQMFSSIEKSSLDKQFNDVMPITIEDNGYYNCNLSHNNTGFIGTKIQCKEDTVLYITFDEIYNAKEIDVDSRRVTQIGCTNVIKYYLKKGYYELETMEPYTLKYLKIMTTKECVVHDIYIKEYVNPDTDRTTFKCNNKSINKIYEAGKTTFVQNALDIYMDCPSRERAGWLCDSYFTGRVEYDLTGNSVIEKNFLENFMLPSSFKCLPEGMLPMCYPADHYDEVFIPNWALWFIMELEEYLERSQDIELVDKLKEKVYNLLKYFKKFKNSDGLLEKLESWIFVEWSKCNDFVQDVNYPTNMLYSAALIAAGKLYSDNELVEEGNRIKEVVRQQAYNGEFFVDNAIRENEHLVLTDNITETCQYYAFYFGVATKELYPQLYDIMVNKLGPNRKEEELSHVHPSNAFIGNYLRLEVLSKNEEHSRVVHELEDYFLYMAEMTGTLWENKGTTASCNHGFASHVIRCIYRDGVGIKKIDKATKTIMIDTEHIMFDWYEMTLVIDDSLVHIQYNKDKQLEINSSKGYLLKDIKA